MTRIAGANPRMWTDILLDNAEAVREELAEHSAADRARSRRHSSDGDAGFLARFIGEAAREPPAHARAVAYADAGALHRVRVHVPDRPGVLAEITQALGAERINIEDFGLEHISPERGGTVTLLVTGADQARAAPPSCSKARATTSSFRRCSMKVEPAARGSTATSPFPVTSRSRIARC